MEILSKRIKQLRQEKDMTQKELALLLHVQRTTITGYETKDRHPQLDIIIHIADIFGVTTDYLLGRTDKR